MSTPAARSTAGDRLPSLTGLRAIAALMVFGFHVWALGIFASPGVNKVLAHSVSEGVIGVTFFFILSGFILTWTARDSDTTTAFWRRRYVKILPNHLVTWVIAFVFLSMTGLTLTGTFQRFGLDSIPNLFLLQPWFPRGQIFFSMNIPSWSLGCEAFFYLLFPFTLPVVRRIAPGRLWTVAVGLLVAVVAMPFVAQIAFHDGTNVPTLPVTNDRMWFVYTLPPVRWLEFLLGMVLARIVREGRWIRVGLWPATGLVLVAYVGASYLPYLYSLVAGAVVPLALLVPAAAAADLAGKPSPWRSPVWVWLGNVSFAFYMIHQLVIRWTKYELGFTRSWDTPAAIGVTALILAIALAAATVLYYAVERPIVRWFSGPRRRIPAVVPASRTVLPAPAAVLPAAAADEAAVG
jgi:peptidoglycan/LPS O-acetylase OafA/YrhL